MSFCCLGVGLLLSVSRRDSSSFCPVKWLFQMMQAGRFNDPLPMMCRESDRGCSIVKPNASSSPYSLPDALAGTLCCYCSFPGMKKRECTTYRRTLLAFVCQVPSYWTGKTYYPEIELSKRDRSNVPTPYCLFKGGRKRLWDHLTFIAFQSFSDFARLEYETKVILQYARSFFPTYPNRTYYYLVERKAAFSSFPSADQMSEVERLLSLRYYQ